MAVDLSTEVKNRRIAASLTNGDDESDTSDTGDEAETTDSDTEEKTDESSVAPARQEPSPVQTLADYGGAPAPVASPTPTQPVTYPTIAEDQTGAPLSAAPTTVPAGHIDLGPPGRNIYTDPDTGSRYIVDPGAGKLVPHAELATAADKAAQPPEGVVLPQVDVTPAPNELAALQQESQYEGGPGLPGHPTMVPRAQLVRVPGWGEEEGLPVTPTPSKVERAQLVGAVPGGQEIQSLSAGSTKGPIPQAGAPAQPAAPAAPVAGPGIQTLSDYSGGTYKPQQITAAQPAAAGQVSAEPQIDIQSQSYTQGRTQEPTKLILHSTDGSSEKADINTLTGAEPGHRVSVNYYVTKDGRVMHFVSENDTAWHAGADRDGNNGNAYTLGIEQQHVDGKEPWPDAQVRATAGVAAGILARHPNMTIDDVIGHSDLAGERKQDPVDYPWAKFRKYVAEAQGQPAQQAAAPSAQPVTKQKNGFYQDEKPNDFLSGRVTTFATPDDIASGQDNGVGSPHLGTLDTTRVAGVALPQWVLQQMFPGKDWAAAARQARVDVVDPTTGKRLRVPIVDLGPGDAPQNAGVVSDMTPALANYFGGDKNLSIKIVPKAGPDVMKNPQLFYDEQAAIKNGFDSGSLQANRQVIGPQFATRAQTPEEATAAQQTVQAAVQKQNDLLAKLPDAQGDNPSLIGLYKRLDDSVDGVTPQIRQAMQAGLKTKIIAAMRDKFPDIKTDDEAWTKAQSNVGPLEVGAEAWSQLLGGFQQYTSVLQKGVAGTDQLHVNQFLDSAIPGATDQQKNDYLAKLYGMPIDQRIAEVQSHLPQPQTGIPSTDPQQIISALDRLHNTDYQKQQASDLATAAADMKRNLTTDPRLVGTGVGKIVDGVAQIPAFVAAYRNPVMLPMVLAQTNDMAREQLKQDHPDWDEKTISENAARATAVMFLGQEAGAKLMGAGGGVLLDALKGSGKRAIAQVLAGIAGGSAINASTQAGVNVATGAPIGRGVGDAAIIGAIQGGATGIVHGAGELTRPGERPAVVEPPPVQPPTAEATPPRPVTAAEVTGPEVSDQTPWYQPGPIVTRAEQPETFSPSQLAEGVAGMRAGGTPEEMRQAAENLQPPADFRDRGVYLGDVGQVEVDQAMAAQARQNLYPIDQNGNPKVSESEPWVSQIANRFTAERMGTGELGTVEPGVGVTKEEMLARGLQMSPEQINQHVSNVMNDVGGNPRDQAAAIRTEEARLSQRSHNVSLVSEADPTNQQLRIDADNAFKDLTDFHNGPVAKLKNNWHAQGITLQGERLLDLTSYNGLRDAYLRDVGKAPPPEMEPVMRNAAKRVRDATDAESAAMRNLGTEIERQSARRRLPSDEEVRMRIMERVKDMPCPT